MWRRAPSRLPMACTILPIAARSLSSADSKAEQKGSAPFRLPMTWAVLLIILPSRDSLNKESGSSVAAHVTAHVECVRSPGEAHYHPVAHRPRLRSHPSPGL